MRLSSVAVVSDSAASIPFDLQRKLGLSVVPVHVAIDDQLFVEGVNISAPRVIDALLAGATVRTSAPTPREFLQTYMRLANEGAGHIVSVHVASTLSKTYESAVIAATESPVPVTVIDTRTLAMAQGFAALAAAAIARFDGDPNRVAIAARAVAAGSRLAFTVESLEYLRRGGRVSATVAAVGTMLNLRPIMEVRDGETVILDRVRGADRAREDIRRMMAEHALTLERPAAAIALVGGSAIESGLSIEAETVVEASSGASLTAHTGPGTYAVALADMPNEFFLAL